MFNHVLAPAADSLLLSALLASFVMNLSGQLPPLLTAAAVGLEDGEHILRRTAVWWSLGLVAFVTVLVVLQSTPVLSWMVP